MGSYMVVLHMRSQFGIARFLCDSTAFLFYYAGVAGSVYNEICGRYVYMHVCRYVQVTSNGMFSRAFGLLY